MSQPEIAEHLARLEVLFEHALSEVRTIQKEFAKHVVTHDGSARDPGHTLPACQDDDPPSRPL